MPNPIARPSAAPTIHPIAIGTLPESWVTVLTSTTGDAWGWTSGSTDTVSPFPAPVPLPTTMAPVIPGW